jgi:hypothetical protein
VHAGGPLGEGLLKGDYLVCPWHGWQFHCRTGEGRPGYGVAVPRYETKVEGGGSGSGPRPPPRRSGNRLTQPTRSRGRSSADRDRPASSGSPRPS